MTVHNKLVRDLVTKDLEKLGIPYESRKIKSDSEYFDELLKKLREEIEEYLTEFNPKELPDVLEVVYALSAFHGITNEELDLMRQEKLQTKGGFEKRIFLISS